MKREEPKTAVGSRSAIASSIPAHCRRSPRGSPPREYWRRRGETRFGSLQLIRVLLDFNVSKHGAEFGGSKCLGELLLGTAHVLEPCQDRYPNFAQSCRLYNRAHSEQRYSNQAVLPLPTDQSDTGLGEACPFIHSSATSSWGTSIPRTKSDRMTAACPALES